MSWHQIDCKASRVRDRDGDWKSFQRTGFRTGVVDGQEVRVEFVPSSNWWIVAASGETTDV